MTEADRDLIEALGEFYVLAMPYIVSRAAKNDDQAFSIMSFAAARVDPRLDAVQKERGIK